MAGNAPVSVIIPTLNEAGQIAGLLDHFLNEPPEVVAEILVADGGSTDGTREIVLRHAAHEPRVALVDNPDRLQAAGLNRAVAEASPATTTIVRVDAHADYPDHYAERLLRAMAETGADSVVVRMESRGRSALQRAIATISNSPIGTGGAAHRMGRRSGFIDHGHHAAMSRRRFEAAGGYDPSFETNEDAEFDCRLRRAGGRIWLAADIVVTYHPRATLAALARQYFRYGRGRARTVLKHRERPRIRQLIPVLLVIATALALAAAPFRPGTLLLPSLYLAAVAAVVAGMALRRREPSLLLAVAALPVMHFGWGLGFLRQLAAPHRAKDRIG